MIPFAKKDIRYRKNNSSFVRKNRQKPRRTEVVKLFCGAFVIKNGDEKFLKANNYENGEKNSSN